MPPTWRRSLSRGRWISYAAEGQLVDISQWFNIEKLGAEQVGGFVELTEFDGGVYGVYYKTDVKSIVWYPVAPFEEPATRFRPPGTR